MLAAPRLVPRLSWPPCDVQPSPGPSRSLPAHRRIPWGSAVPTALSARARPPPPRTVRSLEFLKAAFRYRVLKLPGPDVAQGKVVYLVSAGGGLFGAARRPDQGVPVVPG